MVKKLANEFIKNVKIMFRNWASLSLLIIAPLVFILLIGYAFSSDELKGINIGVYSDKNINLSLLSEGVKKYGTIKEYNNLQQCLSDLTLQKMHVCIHIEGAPFERNFQGNNIETAKITYYYDETRKKVSLSIIRNVKEFFGLKAEEMSIESTESIIEGIQNLIGFINERRNEINQLRNEAMQLRDEQIERKIKLEKVRSDFLPPYMLIKETQANMHNYSLRANKTSEEIKEDINRTIVLVREIKNTAIILLPPKLEEVGINETVNITNMTAITMLLEGIEKDLIILQNITDNATSDANSLVAEVDGIVKRIDTIKIMLDDEIARADASIAEIDKRVAQIEQISKELDEKLSGLAILEPG
ncbi:MAG: hypothetical protein N3D84_03790, partial [Candidatus Woesearchaeota archaeon]|nr:hypothetical protein [Candidatus Woesearchaeota archaeon]